jgi:hypothetical protein
VLLQDIGPGFQLRTGKIPINTPYAGLAELRYLLEQSSRDLRRGVIGVDEHGKTGQSLLFGWHEAPPWWQLSAHSDAISPIPEKSLESTLLARHAPRLLAISTLV